MSSAVLLWFGRATSFTELQLPTQGLCLVALFWEVSNFWEEKLSWRSEELGGEEGTEAYHMFPYLLPLPPLHLALVLPATFDFSLEP